MGTTAVQTQAPNAIATRTGGGDIKKWIQSDHFKDAVAAALPKHLTKERFIRVCMTALLKTPKLVECTQESVFECMLTLSSLGLEPDGRRAHLIPFKKNTKTDKGWKSEMRCQLILDYKGIVELVMNSGLVSNIHADVVCENDEFEYNMGEVVKHKIDFKQERGIPYAAYCRIRFKDGTVAAEAMSMLEVQKVKARSKSADDGPWVTDFNEMAKKTVFKRLSKWCIWATDPDRREMVNKDDDQFIEEPRKIREAATIELSQLTASSDENRGHDDTAARQITEADFEEVAAQKQAAVEETQTIESDGPPENLPHHDVWPEGPAADWIWVGQGVFRLDADGNYQKHSIREWQMEEKSPATKTTVPKFGRGK